MTVRALLLLLGAALPASAALLRSDYPPTAHTGGFGEPTCIHCHTDSDLNSSGGALRIEGVPGQWRAGEIYRLEIVMRREGLERAGFELSARFADGRGAGVLLPGDQARVAVTRDSVNGLGYAHHTRDGTRGWAGEARWPVQWVAPSAGSAEVVFHAASVASNDDDSNLGDAVFTASARAIRAVR